MSKKEFSISLAESWTLLTLGQHEKAVLSFQKDLKFNKEDFNSWIGLASAQFNLNNYQDSISSYDNALQLNSKSFLAWIQRGIALANLDRHLDALSSYKSALKIKPKDAKCLYEIGNVLRLLNRHKEAIKSYNKSLKFSPFYFECHCNLSISLLALGRHKEALLSINKALKLKPNNVNILYSQGTILMCLRRYEEAIQSFDAALNLDSYHFPSYVNKGNILSLLKRYEEAIKIFKMALSLHKKSFTPFLWNMGDCLMNLKKYEEALLCFDEALKNYGKPYFFQDQYIPIINSNKYHELLASKANALLELKNYEESICNYDMALELDPCNFVYWQNRGVVLRKLNQYEEAVISFDKSLDINPDNSECWHLRGHVFEEVELYKEAISSYDKALKINPEDYISWNCRGKALAKFGYYEHSIISFKNALTIHSNDSYLWSDMGNVLKKLGSYDEALNSYEKALEIESENFSVWFNKGNLLGLLNRHVEALDSFNKSLSINSKYFDSWRNRGTALFALGDYEKAIASYDKALEIEPKDPYAWINRGLAAVNSYRPRELTSLSVGATDFPVSALSQVKPLLDLRGYEGQIQTLKIGLEHFESNSEDWIRLKHALGNAHFTQAQKEQLEPRQVNIAQTYFNKAKACYHEALTAIGNEISELRLEIYLNLIKLLYNRKEKEAAPKYIREAADCLNLLIAQTPSPHIKKQLSLKFSSLNELSVIVLLEEGQPVQALETADRDKNACLVWFFAPQWTKLTDIPSPTWADIQTLLKPGTAILYWHYSLAGITAFILASDAPDQPQIHRCGYEQTQQINQWIANWQADYQSYRESKLGDQHPWRTSLKNSLSELAQLLQIQTILPKLGNAYRLLLIPHQTLHLLPLHSLFPDQYLITYLPSLQSALQQQNQQNQPQQPPSGYFGLEATADLPLAHLETQLISQQFTPHTVLSAQDTLTPTDFSDALIQHQGTFHYSGHGIHNGDRPTHSAFELTKTKTLTALELYQHCDFSRYRRVILSSCELALTGKAEITAEYVGLGSVILAKGSRYVISPLWRVSELTCLFLMLRLFDLLNDPHGSLSEPEALRGACQWLKNVTVAELKKQYRSQFQAIERLLANRESSLKDQVESGEKSNIGASVQETVLGLKKLGEIKKELKELLQRPDNEQPFNDPYHFSAFICQGLA